MLETNEVGSLQDLDKTPHKPWIERFSSKENYSEFSLAILEACKVFFETKISTQERKKLLKMGIAVGVTGSLLRGNAKPGSDIDLMFLFNEKKVLSVLSLSRVPYNEISDWLHTEELSTFIVEYLREKHNHFYQQFLQTKVQEFNSQIHRYLGKYGINKDTTHWSNVPEDQRTQYIEKKLAFFVEVGSFDVTKDPKEIFSKILDDDDLIHGVFAVLFSSDLQTLLGNVSSLRNEFIELLKNLRETDTNKFQEFYKYISEALGKFLSYSGKNHFYLESADQLPNSNKIDMPLLDEF